MVEESMLEWEDNTQNLPFKCHMIAGSCAGVAEHVLVFPIDTLKVNSSSDHHAGLIVSQFSSIRSILQDI
jgi:solute carrier family 25 iron transporter 28/37